jgi:hypothetical protein
VARNSFFNSLLWKDGAEIRNSQDKPSENTFGVLRKFNKENQE